MKILLVNDYATPTGGAEVQTFALRDGLRARGHDARLFASSAGLDRASGSPDYCCFGTTTGFRTALQTANPSAYLRLRRVLETFAPDVVHVRIFLTQLSPAILPLLRSVPSICHVVWYRPVCPVGTKLLPDGRPCEVRPGRACLHSGCVPLRDWPLHMLQRRLLRRWMEAFDRVVAVSDAVRVELEADGIAPVEVIGNGVAPRSARLPLSDPPTVAYAGRLVREKGVDVLLQAFSQVVREIPEARLVVAGSGPESPRLAAQVSANGLAGRVELAGHVPPGELDALLARAWVQAVPSRWRDPFPNVAAEALMRGTAVVASDTGGLTGLVENGVTGYLVPGGDAQALAAALVRLLRDRDLSESMGRRARAFALERLDFDMYLDRLVALYEELVP